MGLRFGAAMLDPVAVGASVLTEGAAAPLVYGAKVGRMSRFIRGGAVAAWTNAAVESYLVSQDPTGDWGDIGYAAAAGFALGGISSQFGRIPEDSPLQAEAGKIAHQMRNTTALTNNGSVGAARRAWTGCLSTPTTRPPLRKSSGNALRMPRSRPWVPSAST